MVVDAEGLEVVGELVSALVELVVGEGMVLEGKGGVVGVEGSVVFEAVVDAGGVGVGGSGSVPVVEEEALFVGCEDREGGDGGIGVGDGGFEEGAVVGGEAGDSGGVEEVGVVFEGSEEAVWVFGEGEGKVEAGGTGVEVDRGDGEVRELEGRGGGVIQDEHNLEEGGMAEVAVGADSLDEAIEGEVLVVISGEGDIADASEEVEEGGVTGEVGTEDEGIDEEADEGFDFGVVTVGDR